MGGRKQSCLYTALPYADDTEVMPPDPLDLLRLLFDTTRLMRSEAARRARALGINRAEFTALAVLTRIPGITQRELAERLDVEPITVARLLDRLALRGLVERRPDPRDRRVWRLHLRPEATALSEAVQTELVALAARLTEGMEPATRQSLTAGLRHIAAILAPAAPPDLRQVA